jgi:hypothetical integral membrane protein (TIGR02206 family)
MDFLQYFVRDYHGAPFILFGTAHIVTLIVIALCILGLTRFKGASEQTLRNVRWTMAIVMWVNEIGFHLWNVAIGTWTIHTMLPLQLCNVLVILTGFMLIFKNYPIYEFSYFLGIGAAVQPLLTPDAGIYGFPHYRYIEPMISHGLLVAAGVYMTVVEGFRPTWKSIGRIFVVTNTYMLILFFVNPAVGGNYMMVNYKLHVISLLSLLPDWPWYLLWEQGIALVVFLLLYLPFIIKDWQTKQLDFSVRFERSKRQKI